jgi:hypothetical protein
MGIRAVAALLVLVLPAVSFGEDELAVREAIGREAAVLFRAGRFAELDAQAAEFRASKARTPSGLWKLTNFYSGLARSFDSRRREELYWQQLEFESRKWIKASPKSPTAHLVHASILINRGWSYRGNGYAQSVDPKDWPPFYEHVGRARRHLEEQKGVAAVDPRWYEQMAWIAVYQNWKADAFDALIDEGLRREPLFYQTYFAAMTYYSPKWGGSAREIEQFASKAVERTRASEGMGMYARIYWYASQQSYGERLFTDTQVVWPKMKLGIDDVLARYPDPWNLNNFAKFACLVGDREKARLLVARIGNTPVLAAWRDAGDFERCRNWAKST